MPNREPKDATMIRGGQGRTARDVSESATALLWLGGLALLLLSVLVWIDGGAS